MKLDRNLQRTILEQLRATYPETIDFQTRANLEPDLQSNLYYLHELKLIEAAVSGAIDNPHRIMWARITAAGLDFLEDDGGMSAMLKSVTIKFDEENLRAILENQVIASHMP